VFQYLYLQVEEFKKDVQRQLVFFVIKNKCCILGIAQR